MTFLNFFFICVFDRNHVCNVFYKKIEIFKKHVNVNDFVDKKIIILIHDNKCSKCDFKNDEIILLLINYEQFNNLFNSFHLRFETRYCISICEIFQNRVNLRFDSIFVNLNQSHFRFNCQYLTISEKYRRYFELLCFHLIMKSLTIE